MLQLSLRSSEAILRARFGVTVLLLGTDSTRSDYQNANLKRSYIQWGAAIRQGFDVPTRSGGDRYSQAHSSCRACELHGTKDHVPDVHQNRRKVQNFCPRLQKSSLSEWSGAVAHRCENVFTPTLSTSPGLPQTGRFQGLPFAGWPPVNHCNPATYLESQSRTIVARSSAPEMQQSWCLLESDRDTTLILRA
jgi:hypothetical protein